MRPSKAEIIAALRRSAGEELAAMERVAAMSRDEASGEESRSENQYDTRATEAAYLARGLAARIVELRRLDAWLATFDGALVSSAVDIGAVVALDEGELLFIAPVGGGKVRLGERLVSVISPASPLGEALIGLEVGDALEIDSPRGTLSREVVGVW